MSEFDRTEPLLDYFQLRETARDQSQIEFRPLEGYGSILLCGVEIVNRGGKEHLLFKMRSGDDGEHRGFLSNAIVFPGDSLTVVNSGGKFRSGAIEDYAY